MRCWILNIIMTQPVGLSRSEIKYMIRFIFDLKLIVKICGVLESSIDSLVQFLVQPFSCIRQVVMATNLF